jgi:hypothetical protein
MGPNVCFGVCAGRGLFWGLGVVFGAGYFFVIFLLFFWVDRSRVFLVAAHSHAGRFLRVCTGMLLFLVVTWCRVASGRYPQVLHLFGGFPGVCGW